MSRGMLAPLRTWAWALLRRLRLAGPVLAVLPGGYLYRMGWMRSVSAQRSLSATGEPQPWYTYPFLRFFLPRVSADWRVFEFGAGASTLFYAARVKSVESVEHDPRWVEALRPQLPPNATLHVRAEAHYPAPLATSAGDFDLIVIDGIARPACCRVAPSKLSARGVIVVDNSERPEYASALLELETSGFRRLDFFGLAAISNHETCTSVFYRSGNCLGI